MNIVHVVPAIANEASGPSYSVIELCKALRSDEIDVSLAVLDSDRDYLFPDFVKTFPITGIPQRLGRSSAMHRWLRQIVITDHANVVHSHSFWMMPNIYPGWATQGTKTPLVVSPRGTLSGWALNRSKWIKRVLWVTFQQPAIRHAACFHATAESEYDDIRRAGFNQPVCIIPNGIDIPKIQFLTDVVSEGPRRLLFLSRIHPKKGIENLLRAWAVVENRYPDWILDIVGPDNNGHLEQMQVLAGSLNLSRVNFQGPLYGADKRQAYQQAELYVLPTHSENFGMTVAEALASGTSVITTKGAPWEGLETHRAGWWIDIGVDPLVACLEEALACSSEELAVKGAAGRRWMQEEFSWERIGRMMLATYRWLEGSGNMPEWIRV